MTPEPAASSGIAELSLVAFMPVAADLVQHVDQSSFLDVLRDALRTLVKFDHFIVFHYQESCAAELIASSFDLTRLRAQMAPYINGLYLLDPFYIAATVGQRRGMFSMREVVPPGFEESEYFRIYYQTVGVIEDARYLIEIAPRRHVEVYLEREPPLGGYASQELERLRAIEPLVRTCVQKHWAWRGISASVHSNSRTPLGQGVRSVIANLGGAVLTAREIDIVELAIKGHSSKSIAHSLEISEGTVINHKRNVYSKLQISSQSQLFHVFLQALY
jgi:DNA-binding CsgD family transcriptional regulator